MNLGAWKSKTSEFRVKVVRVDVATDTVWWTCPAFAYPQPTQRVLFLSVMTKEEPMKYTITPGIAALVHVECETFPERYGSRKTAFIFMAEGKPIEKGCGDPIKFSDLPEQVQASVAKHFEAVFALPIEARGKYLDSLTPWEIEA